MYDHAFSKLANHQIRHQATHWHMVTLIFLRGLCGHVWVNIPTLSPLYEFDESIMSNKRFFVWYHDG